MSTIPSSNNSNEVTVILSEKAERFLDSIDRSKGLNSKIIILGESVFKIVFHTLISEDMRKDLDLPIETQKLSDKQEAAVAYAQLIGITAEYIKEVYEDYLKSLML